MTLQHGPLIDAAPLAPDELARLDAWWRGCNYLSAGMIYLRDSPLLKTPLEPAIKNQIDRFNLVFDVIDRVPTLRSAGAHVKERMKNAILENLHYAYEEGTDRPEVAGWTWPGQEAP